MTENAIPCTTIKINPETRRAIQSVEDAIQGNKFTIEKDFAEFATAAEAAWSKYGNITKDEYEQIYDTCLHHFIVSGYWIFEKAIAQISISKINTPPSIAEQVRANIQRRKPRMNARPITG